ncbi:hypothetical protein EJB05_33853, partial [Eragrostis curvula]
IVSSAVAHQAVNQALSSIKERYDEKSDANVKEHIERMEMAHIKLEAALEKSHKWNTTSVPLLRWRSKLKRAAQECNDMLRSCKQRLQEMEAVEDENRMNPPFDEYSNGLLRVLRYMELGGTPRLYMFFDPLVRHLLEGKGTTYGIIRGSQQLTFLLLPFYLPEHGIEVRMKLLLEDGLAPQNNFIFALYIRLSESTDIVGVTLRCLQLFAPYLRSTAETMKIKLTQLPTQDFNWAHPYSMSSHRKLLNHWNNLHTIFSQWTRPNPLCCQQHSHHYAQSYAGSSTRSSSESLTCDTYLEPVSQVFLQGHVALSAGHKRRRSVLDDESCPMRDFPNVEVSGLFSPHASYEDLSAADGGSATTTGNPAYAECQMVCQVHSIGNSANYLAPPPSTTPRRPLAARRPPPPAPARRAALHHPAAPRRLHRPPPRAAPPSTTRPRRAAVHHHSAAPRRPPPPRRPPQPGVDPAPPPPPPPLAARVDRPRPPPPPPDPGSRPPPGRVAPDAGDPAPTPDAGGLLHPGAGDASLPPSSPAPAHDSGPASPGLNPGDGAPPPGRRRPRPDLRPPQLPRPSLLHSSCPGPPSSTAAAAPALPPPQAAPRP